MGYVRKVFVFPNSREVEYHFIGKQGRKGEKRAPRKKPTPEQIKKQNQKNKEKRVRRLIKANFTRDDLWVTLKYPAGTRKPLEEVKADLYKFFLAMRRKLKRRGQELKYIYRIEVGSKKGGIHAHVVMTGCDTSLIRDTWTGYAHYEYLRYEVEQLASYLVKEPDEEAEGQMSLFTDEEKKIFVKYGCSRNLVKVEPEVKAYTHWTMRSILEKGPLPTDGYYIIRDTVKCGVNQFTGKSYLYYTEERLKEVNAGQYLFAHPE